MAGIFQEAPFPTCQEELQSQTPSLLQEILFRANNYLPPSTPL